MRLISVPWRCFTSSYTCDHVYERYSCSTHLRNSTGPVSYLCLIVSACTSLHWVHCRAYTRPQHPRPSSSSSCSFYTLAGPLSCSHPACCTTLSSLSRLRWCSGQMSPSCLCNDSDRHKPNDLLLATVSLWQPQIGLFHPFESASMSMCGVGPCRVSVIPSRSIESLVNHRRCVSCFDRTDHSAHTSARS